MSRIVSLALMFTTGYCLAQTPSKDIVRGMLVTEGLTGRTVVPHGWTIEKVYSAPLSKEAGIGVETLREPPGRFEMRGGRDTGYPDFAPGQYAFLTLGFDQIPAFSVLRDALISPDAGAPDNLELRTPVHYACMFNKHYSEWGKAPYVEGTDFYQTFVATSTHITRIATKLGGKSGDHVHLMLNYAIYEPDSGPPSTWKRISPVRSRIYGNGVDPIIHIYHVTYRSNEMSLKPGKTYAVRFWRDPSSVSETFTLVARPDRGDGYRDGELYRGDTPRPELDAYAYISGGEPGTIVNHAPIGDTDLKKLAGSALRFGQTFKATGHSLAAVDIIYTDGKIHPPSVPILFQLYDRPDGTPIGPARTCYGLPTVFQGRAAALWMQNQAPLTPGHTYYIEWKFPIKLNTWVMNEDLSGEAYREGKALLGADLEMSIVEYEGENRSSRSTPSGS